MTHRVVLISACVLELAVGAGIAAIVLNFFLISLASTDSFLWPSTQDKSPDYTVWQQALLVTLPVAALLFGAAPAMARVESWGARWLSAALSLGLCVVAVVVYFVLMILVAELAVGMREESTIIALSVWLTVPAVPFAVVPLLVDRWT